MKKIRYLFLISVILTTSFSCCKDDDGLQSDDQGNFAEYFTCKINGVEFNPTGTFNCNNLSFYYYKEATAGIDAGYFLLSGVDCPTYNAIALRIFGMNPNTGYLDFLEPAFADSCSPIVQSVPGEIVEGMFYYDQLISGSMNITAFTPRDSVTEKLGKIEGTFEFTVANEENDSIIHVTDGAFRFKVPNIW
ncbi:hypothetical protein G3O08_16830 [Cryomorpha ignava]|uniref:Lipocalin-like domain-containing protein n=1 Tax=Cryomorpha ignava TaxID=101383 RepID=A0A7K3WUE2_9FLAO|nr:hypothetical protein [Cryomorpha ignava]NEN25168.1 hypothetical protein [Cryomorpha ignava]